MILVSTTTATQRFAIDPAHTNAQFSIRHLMISKVHGRFSTIAGTIEVPEGATVPTAVEATIEVDSIDTREPQRDGHLKSPDFFDAEKFPQITFRSTRFEGDGESFTIVGDLTMHGVTREVKLDTTFEGRGADPWGNNRIGYEAHAKINRRDFGLNWNVALEAGGVTVGDEVKIELNIEAIAQQ